MIVNHDIQQNKLYRHTSSVHRYTCTHILRKATALLAIALLLYMPHQLHAQKVVQVSILDIAPDYGIPTAYIIDTTNFVQYLNSNGNSLMARASMCINISSRAQTMLLSLRTDYPRHDNVIWLSESKMLYDFDAYQENLQSLALIATRYSQKFLNEEEKRQQNTVAVETPAAPQEDLTKQKEIETQIANLVDTINEYHDSITSRCLKSTPSTARERKNIYYTYLPIYNQITSTGNNNDNYLQNLEQLKKMQEHMLEHVISDSCYSIRINNFQQHLKDVTGEEYIDIYRSYCRNFTHTSTPISFSTITGYYRYTQQMEDIIAVQQDYENTMPLIFTIKQNNENILQLYTKPYTDIANAYKKLYADINTTPKFNRIEESSAFIEYLNNFINIQQQFITNHNTLERIRQRADDIVNTCPRSCIDLRDAYLSLPTAPEFVPTATTLLEMNDYTDKLHDFEQIQQNFYDIVSLRDSIQRLEKLITSNPNAEKSFINGYKIVKEASAVTSTLATAAAVDTCVQQLRSFIEKQQQFQKVIVRKDNTVALEKEIQSFKSTYPNIYNTYNILINSYTYNAPINNLDDLQQYHIRLIETESIQTRYLNILKSDKAPDINRSMLGLRDLQQIKNIFHL